jgi:hypothetical protein
MGLLKRDILLQKQELQIEKVNLENGDFVYVKEMTGREREIFERSLYFYDKNSKEIIDRNENFRAKLVVCSVCDEDGKLLLKPSDVEQLSDSIGAKRLELIVNKAQELNKIGEDDKKQLTKNSDASPDDNSNSDSVAN